MIYGLSIILLALVIAVIYCLINLLLIAIDLRKIQNALIELNTMPLDEWEAKWGEWVDKEYNKCDDPHREEVERDMEFFKKCREEAK